MKKIIACLSLLSFLLVCHSDQVVGGLDQDTPCGQGAACRCNAPTKVAFELTKTAAKNSDPATTVLAAATFMGVWWYREQIAQTARVVYAGVRLYPGQAALLAVTVGLVAEAIYSHWDDLLNWTSFEGRA